MFLSCDIASQDYLTVVNNFRANLPERYSAIEPTNSVVKQKVTEVTDAYQTLLGRVHKLNDAFSGLADKQRQYNDAYDKASTWLRDTTKQANKLLEEPVGADSKIVQDQVDKVLCSNEFINYFAFNTYLNDGVFIVDESLEFRCSRTGEEACGWCKAGW